MSATCRTNGRMSRPTDWSAHGTYLPALANTSESP